jgi:type II secretory pathway pseudopilin PulG
LTVWSNLSSESKGGAYGPALRLVSLPFRIIGRRLGTACRLSPRRLAGDRGLTLIELLVAATMFIALMAAVVPLMTNVINDQPKISKAAARISEARALTERLGRELRQAYAVDSASATQLVFRTYTRAATCGGTTLLAASAAPTQCRVTYSCASGTCTRTERNADGSGTAGPVELVNGLNSSNVFTYTPSSSAPEFVHLTIVMPGRSSGKDAITLEDGFALRNVIVPS